MNAEQALILIKEYIAGWKANNFSLIASALHPECIIIESHGPQYSGIDEIYLWFEFWLAANSTILKWNVTSYDFCDDNITAFIEWEFACVSNNTTYAVSGISVIKFLKDKIVHMHEYRMTQPAFPWDKKTLVSK